MELLHWRWYKSRFFVCLIPTTTKKLEKFWMVRKICLRRDCVSDDRFCPLHFDSAPASLLQKCFQVLAWTVPCTKYCRNVITVRTGRVRSSGFEVLAANETMRLGSPQVAVGLQSVYSGYPKLPLFLKSCHNTLVSEIEIILH